MKTTVKKPTKKELNTLSNKIGRERAIQILDITFINPERVLALGIELGLTIDELINEITENTRNDMYEFGNKEYYVLTDDEADTKNDESIESYIDECIMPELPKHLQNYFDDERFKRDARMDGRGHNLAAYDGHENYQTVNGTTYYIYRWN